MPPAVLLLLLAAPARAGDDYTRLAADVAAAARKAGVRRMAVLRLEAVGRGDAAGPAAVSERLVGRLAGQPGLTVVERALLDRVLEEQKLSNSGAIDPRDAPALGRLMGVQAVLTGSLIAQAGGKVEVNLRLVNTSDARVLGSAMARVTQDWEAAPAAGSDVTAPPPPSLDGDFTAFWEAGGGDPRCRGWERRVMQLDAVAQPLPGVEEAARQRARDAAGELTRRCGR